MSALNTLNGRLTTFKKNGWPHLNSTNYLSTPETLAAAGFYHRPFPGSEDNVACFLCNKNLDGWEPNDEAWVEHTKHAPQCSLVRLDTEAGRMATFATDSHWPHTQSLDAQKMSRAGFFYWPKLMPNKRGIMMDDTAVCFQCGLALDGWEEGDDPHLEHAKRRPECPFVKKGVALHPCSFEFLLGSRPDTNAIRHISSSSANTKDTSAPKFKLPPPRKESKRAEEGREAGGPNKVRDSSGVKQTEATPSAQKSLVPLDSRKDIASKQPFKGTGTKEHDALNGSRLEAVQSTSEEIVMIARPQGQRQSIRRMTASTVKSQPTISKISTVEDMTGRTRIASYDKENDPHAAAKHRRTTVAKPITVDDKTASLLGVTAAQASMMTVEEYIAALQTRKLEEFDGRAREILASFTNSVHQ